MPEVKVHSHSKDSLSICGEPVGKMIRVSSFCDMEELNRVKISHCEKLGKKSSTFVIHLGL